MKQHGAGGDVLKKYKQLMERMDPMRPMGRVLQVTGMSLISEGPPDAGVGDLCRVEIQGSDDLLGCEVVGFQGHNLVLMPLGPTSGITPNARVLAQGRRLAIPVTEDLLGRIVDGLGRPLDSKPPLLSAEQKLVDHDPPLPTERPPIERVMETGVRAIDAMLSIGSGQRVGIFAGTGVGKSTLLGMIARYTRADVNVICLVGERGREVREFIEQDLGEEGLRRSVVFAATSDRSALEKVYCAGFATSVAEYFRDRGMRVNLYMDSLTRYCMALREIGISSGEQIGPGGYPPGVWYRLSRLVERAGTRAGGSITGFYTVLVEADDLTDPVADNARGVLDGHIVLSRRLAQRGHYPAIEITESISRVMDRVVGARHREDAVRLRSVLAGYRENEELINLGAYARGSNPEVDEYLEKKKRIEALLRQDIRDGGNMEDTIEQLNALMRTTEEEPLY